MERKPSLFLKWFFWILLGVLSVAFVEVTTGSQLFPFFNLIGWIAVFPVYFSHIVLLSTLIFRFSKPRIWTLYVAGMLFGMYEAYITKVLWKSYSADGPPIVIGNVAFIETVVLVLVAHAFFAFIIPLFIGENILTKSRDINKGLSHKMKNRLQKSGLLWISLLMIFFGLFQTAPSPLHAIGSGISTTLFVGLLVFLWRKTSGPNYSMSELLPSKKGFIGFLIFTIIVYWVLGVTLDLDYLPTLQGQIGILVIYVFLFILLFKSMKKSSNIELGNYVAPSIKFSWKLFWLMGLLFSVCAFVGNLLFSELTLLKYLVIVIAYFIVGFTMLFKTIKDSFTN